MPSAVVIGGGIGGLTAAHELAERGFSVDVYEARAAWGGKARSQPVANTGTSGRADLPGEHGFRFYPRFYRHVIDTMQRIPRENASVADALRPTTEAAIAMIDDATWFRFPRRQLDTPYSLLESLEVFFQDLDFDAEDVSVFSAKLLQFATSCDARRLAEYEGLSWWQFLAADRCSTKFQRQLRAIPRMMVAMDAVRGSARTIGSTSIQILGDFAYDGATTDRTMGGPTTQMWIDPWIAHLQALGVRLHGNSPVASLDVDGGRIASITLATSGTKIVADYYVLAAPLDAAIGLLSPAIGALDPVLDRLRQQPPDHLVSWMSGIQFFLYEDVPLVRGHLFFPDSPWALTAISQPQFWRGLGLFRKTFGNGEVGGLLSVDISEFDAPGTYVKKRARDCTPDEIAREVWAQLKAALNGRDVDETILTDDVLHSWHLDDDLSFGPDGCTNHSRLLVHPPGSWALRPEAATAVPNLVLASDYVRTHTDIASMEGACEAARRAVNAILERSGSTAARAHVWPLEEPAALAHAKRLDGWLHDRGHGHAFELMGIRRGVEAAAWLRKAESALGLDVLDDWIDQWRLTDVVRALARRFGLP